MGIIKFIQSVCVQTAVYWGNPVNDGRGNYVYDYPREIAVRWDDKQEMIIDNLGRNIVSKAQILLIEDLPTEGVVFLGTLDALELVLDSTEIMDPKNINGTYEILSKSKTPLFKSSTEFVHTLYLGRSKF